MIPTGLSALNSKYFRKALTGGVFNGKRNRQSFVYLFEFYRVVIQIRSRFRFSDCLNGIR